MITAQTITHVSRRLETSLGHAGFPTLHRRLGADLLSKLQQAVQVTVIGLPKSGKTSLINMLLGWSIIPALGNVQRVNVLYGPQPRTLIEYSDGAIEDIQGLIEEGVFDRPVTCVTIELPEEQLLTQCYSEVTLAGSDADKTCVLEDVAETSAIVIWCSEIVSSEEQELWRAVPEHIKDHSFLALTMADRHQMKGQLVQRVKTLEPFVAEEFYGLYPVATLQALKARFSTDPEDHKLWSLSGGDALCAVIDQQIALGRAEDLDRAKALLDMVGAEQFTGIETPEPSTKQAQGRGPKEGPRDAPSPSSSPCVTPQGEAALEQAMRELEQCAECLATDLAEGRDDTADLFSKCIETVQTLSETLADVAGEDGPIDDLLQDARQGESMLMLLQLEDNEEAATDAVSLMVQLKKEISATAVA